MARPTDLGSSARRRMLGCRSGPTRIPMPVSRGWRVVGRGAAPGPPCTVGPVAAVEGVAGTTVAAKAVAATASVPGWLPVAPNSCVPPPSRFLNQMAGEGRGRRETEIREMKEKRKRFATRRTRAFLSSSVAKSKGRTPRRNRFEPFQFACSSVSFEISIATSLRLTGLISSDGEVAALLRRE